ncbi:aminotransferase class IV [Pelagibius sp. Alg239-R121]|uniref:aminotransferase class IV n=1 Tax=Pelagibius sp. Alg239-R121 TaxID=2993448 RepID=UPI0024A7A13A|nr:aminotransferase class IV [Pelagibius sp. Alg239-R121]
MADNQQKSSTHEALEDERNADIRIYVDGEILRRDDAKVSVYDSGFMLGDGIWEGLRLQDGVVYFLEDHLDRLYEAALYIDLEIGKTREQLTQAIQDTLDANNMQTDVHIRLMVTRGRKRKPFQHPHLSVFGSTIVIIAEHSRPSEDVIHKGIRLHTVPHHRGLPLTQDAKLNSHSKLNCIIALNHALRAGADEALMLDPFGFVNTTNACNFFIVRKGEVWTSTGDYCMNGITRQKVIDLCRDNGIPVYERNYSLVDSYGADEVFLTGTFGAQTPVFEIDGRIIGGRKAGPVFLRLRELYKSLIRQAVQQGK